jgi:uncharacterized membrane protein YbhN (UPF0104 family)
MKLTRDALRDTLRAWQGAPRLRTWMQVGTVLFTIGFLIFLLIRGREELSQFDNWRAYLTVCGQGFLLYPLSLTVQAWVWGMMIARLGQVAISWRDVEIFAYTHLMRRLPGAVWYLAGRTMIYRERGIRASVTLAASGLEFILLVLVAVVLSAALSLSSHSGWLLVLAALILIVLIIPWGLAALPSASDRRWIPGFARKRLANLSGDVMPKSWDLALWVVAYLISYVVGGLILFLLARSIAPESDVTLTNAIRIWALAVGVAFLTSAVSPAGLGIRELTLTALLSPYMPTLGAVLVAVLLRMLFIVSDLVWGGLMWLTARLLGCTRAGTA